MPAIPLRQPMLRHAAVAVVMCFTIASCADPAAIDSGNAPVASGQVNGTWTNRYRNDPNLAGVMVQQFTDGDDNFSFEERNGKHPCMVLYAFWDNRYVQIAYTPDGYETSKFWFKIDESTQWLWDHVDFSHGSDPTFERHPDPRIRWKRSTQTTKAAASSP